MHANVVVRNSVGFASGQRRAGQPPARGLRQQLVERQGAVRAAIGLGGAQLQEANLKGAQLQEAKLPTAQLQEATSGKKREWTQAFNTLRATHLEGAHPDATEEERCLFNLKNDPGESKDLAKERPEILKRMQDLYGKWSAEIVSQPLKRQK